LAVVIFSTQWLDLNNDEEHPDIVEEDCPSSSPLCSPESASYHLASFHTSLFTPPPTMHGMRFGVVPSETLQCNIYQWPPMPQTATILLLVIGKQAGQSMHVRGSLLDDFAVAGSQCIQ
jgi:hypothetical protein